MNWPRNSPRRGRSAMWRRSNERFGRANNKARPALEMASPFRTPKRQRSSARRWRLAVRPPGLITSRWTASQAIWFFMIAAPEGGEQTHLQALAKLSSLLMDASFRTRLERASDEEEILRLFKEKENKGEEPSLQGAPSGGGRKVLAVTACPTGIAHTYMAADALKAKATEMGVSIKVETNGSDGVKNALTAKEIEEATAIIVAADKQVEMDRFDGKHVIQVPVAQAIREPEKLIEQALRQDAPSLSGKRCGTRQRGSGETAKPGFYKHLMNGVSNMLPFVVGGGILIALSFTFGIKAFDPKDPSYHPFAKLLMDIGGGNAFALMVPVLAAFIAMSIADRPGFAPGMVGGFLAANGGAGFLGGLIAGFLAGYLVVGLRKLFSRLPQSLEGIKPVLLYPVFGIFLTGIVMMYVVIDPVKALNEGLKHWLSGMGTANLVLLGAVLGGMMAVDMGGPINKAAYTFGLAMIEAGNFAPHAAIMAGGMVPPLGLALATTFFKRNSRKPSGKPEKRAISWALRSLPKGRFRLPRLTRCGSFHRLSPDRLLRER